MKTNEEFAWKGFQLLLQRPDFPRFFEVLRDAGFFAPEKNPPPIPGERENTVRIPFWAPLAYLKAVAAQAGAQNDLLLAANVMNVVREVSAWRDKRGESRSNYHTNYTFAEILGLVPTSTVKISDVGLLAGWLIDPYERMLVVSVLDKGVLSRFLNSADPEDWKKAAQVLYQTTAIAWSEDGDKRERAPTSVVDDFWLGELLKHHAVQIGRKAGEIAAEIMLDRVREAFSTPMRRDYSSVFRPAVEDNAQNYQWRSVENRVVEGLRDVLLGWSEEDADSASIVIGRMLKDDLQMIRRVGLYVLAQRWASMNRLYIGVVAPDLFNGHSHELYHLLQDHFVEMDARSQEETVKAIENLPNSAHSDDPDGLRRYSQYRWMSAIKGKGYAPADLQFAELGADPKVGKLSDHPDFDSYITSGWVGPGPTPYSAEEVVALAQANVLSDKLNAIVPDSNSVGSSTDGLAKALENASRTNPEIFLAILPQLLSAKPVYQHAVINGLSGAWETKTDANWDRGWEYLVAFFERVVGSPGFWQQNEDMYQHWVVTAIADFLHAGTKQDEHAYSPTLLPRTQLIIACLMDREPGAATADGDAMTLAINTPKGRVIEALFSQALRAARIANREHGSHRKEWQAIRPIFESELTKCRNANFEFSTLSGTYLPQLQYLDNEWTNEWVDRIFPAAYEVNTVCALSGLSYASFTRQVYEVLKEHGIIDRAFELQTNDRDVRGKLLERIGAAYLWGLEPLEGERFTKLFDAIGIEGLNVLARTFWVVRNEKLSPEQRDRILTFWERSLEWTQHRPQVPAPQPSMLGLLATHITTIGPRERHLLEAVAPRVHVEHESYEFIAELLRLAPQDPAAIMGVLQSMIAAHVPEFDYEDRLYSLLEFLAAHGQREAVIVMTDRLRRLTRIETLFKTLTQH